MGCNHSRNQVGINPKGGAAPGTAPSTPLMGTPVKRKIERPTSKTILVQSKSTEDLTTKTPYENRLLKRRLLKQNTWTGSHEEISTLGNTRGGSATSKFSTHSGDSGFGDKFITEDSKPEDVREVEDSFNDPSGLDMGVVGVACPRRTSAKERAREEQSILDGLRSEGLIAKPVHKATAGVSFEVVAATDLNSDAYLITRKPPARLTKLEKRIKKKRELTEEELKAKMERVEKKRQEREQAKLEKIRARTQKSDVQNALDSFVESQKEKEVEQKSKEEVAAENREKRLKEMRDKLKQKQEHAQKVRHRRKTTEEAIDFSQYPPIAPNRVITEDTPVGPADNS